MWGRKRYRCERVRKNNGVTEVLFKRDDDGQEEIILINVLDGHLYEEGKNYWWQSTPAFPY